MIMAKIAKKAIVSQETKTNKLQKYIFKTNLKIGSIVYKTGEIITLSPCEAKEFSPYIYHYSPTNTDYNCK